MQTIQNAPTGPSLSDLESQVAGLEHIDPYIEGGDLEKKSAERHRPPRLDNSSDTDTDIVPFDTEKDSESHIVVWNGPDDPENPQNWPRSKKIAFTLSLASLNFLITFASSIFSTAIGDVSKLYHVSAEVATLGTSLFVMGFAIGPMVWGPMSELFGRTRPLFFGFVVMAIFQIPVAVAQNLYTVLICRFLGGVFGSSPLAIAGGALVDVWDAKDRGIAICVYAASTFLGPVGGPIVGGFITESYLGWRWTAWITLIMAALLLSLALYFVPESYTPVLLARRANKLRHKTGNWYLHSKSEEQEVNFHAITVTYLLRPLQMVTSESVLLLITLYMAYIYGTLYLFFSAYPISFEGDRGWSQGVGALPFLGMTVGVVFGAGGVAYATNRSFQKAKLEGGKQPAPEERLPAMAVGGVLLAAGLFWFAWTSSPHITWVPQVIAGAPIGMGVCMITIQGFNYLIDVYTKYANSALAANALFRSMAGAGFPLFATPMYNKLGVAWATSLLGFLNMAMIPIPILFYIFGKRLRARSRYSVTPS